MNNQPNQSMLKPLLIGLLLWIITNILSFLFTNLLPHSLVTLLHKQILLYWLIIPSSGLILFLILYILNALKFHKLQKELTGKTKKCLDVKHLTSKSKHFLKEHIKTLTMSYGSNKDVIEELLKLNIIKPYDKINYKLTYWFFECLNKNPSILDYEN